MAVIKLKKASILAIVFFFLCTIVRAQKPDTLFYNLSERKYSKTEDDRYTTLKTKRLVHGYMFFIPCKWKPGTSIISFYGHNNIETGLVLDPITIISDTVFNRLNFISFNKMLEILEKKERQYPGYVLYFIETRNNIHYKYQVKMQGSFFGE